MADIVDDMCIEDLVKKIDKLVVKELDNAYMVSGTMWLDIPLPKDNKDFNDLWESDHISSIGTKVIHMFRNEGLILDLSHVRNLSFKL
ncbi:MAG: hypothetical protein ACRC5M_05015 [Anaeroplasmataceae bacterium]